MKKIITLILISLNLYGYNQLLIVVADEFNSTKASLQAYEYEGFFYTRKFRPIEVNLGKNGLAWAQDDNSFVHEKDEPIKVEGDGRAPAGIFTLSSAFGYSKKADSKMPYIQATKDLICVDDSKSLHYNQVLKISSNVQANSFEWMRRKDNQYRYGIIVDHNKNQEANAGSCIFLHIQKDINSSSAGCTTMNEDELQKLITWLDPKKSPKLIQVPRSSCKEIDKKFRIRCND